MSQYPSNFGQSPGGPSYGGPGGAPYAGGPGGPPYAGGPGGSPYAGGPQQPAPKKGPNWLLIIGIAVGVLALGGAALGVCCCGGGWAAFGSALQMNADAVAKAVRDNPEVQQHIGDISSISFNFEETATASEEGPDRIAYNVTGSKGSGLLVVESNNDINAMEIYYGELILPSGEVYDLGY